MPCGSNQDITDAIIDVIAKIEEVIHQFPDHLIICGGDFNANLRQSSLSSDLMNKFICDNNMEICDKLNSKNANIFNYTYFHESLKHFSYIDFFTFSKPLMGQVLDFNIVDSALNMSDHNAILAYISIECSGTNVDNAVKSDFVQAYDAGATSLQFSANLTRRANENIMRTVVSIIP